MRSLVWVQDGGHRHATEVDREVRPVIDDGRTYLQLSSFGSDFRKREKKVSQTLQFDREKALALAEHIHRLFPSSAT